MHIKVFTVTHSNQMEEPVNRWLDENSSVEIHHVRQSESMNNESWSMTLTIFYTTRDKRIGFEPAPIWVSLAAAALDRPAALFRHG